MKAGESLWRALADGVDLLDTSPGWSARLGDDRALLGGLLRATTQQAHHWPCGLGREDCWRHLIEEGVELMAVCAEQDWSCQTEPVRRASAWLYRFDYEALAWAARTGLGLSGVEPHALRQGVWSLGERTFGEEAVAFYLAGELDRGALDGVTAAEATAGDMRVVLVGREPEAPIRSLAHDRGCDVRPLVEMATLFEGGRLAFDLDDFLLEHRFRGLLDPTRLLSGRVRLLLHPLGGVVWLDGQPLPISLRAKLQWRFLDALADRAGRDVPRTELVPLVHIEDYTPRKAWHIWAQRLKQVREEMPDADWPIRAVPGAPDAGGYRMELAPDEVRCWSDLPDSIRATGRRLAARPRRSDHKV